jgi:hypothetical protein
VLVMLVLASVGCGHARPADLRAIGELVATNDALRTYRTTCGVYPASLETLGASAAHRGSATCASFDLLPRDAIERARSALNVPADGRYALVYTPADSVEGGFERYHLEERWLGSRWRTHLSFWTSDAGVLTYADGRPAIASDTVLPGAGLAGRPERDRHVPPFAEHPTGRFEAAPAAMADFVSRLRAAQPERWITLSAQGEGHRRDSYAPFSVRVRRDVVVIAQPVDATRVTARAGVGPAAFVPVEGGYSIATATPEEAARVLDVVFRHELGLRPFADENDDYAFGAEW